MPLEKGGRADKTGNRYEINWVIYQMLRVLNEQNYAIVLEALGDDEKGTDLLIITKEGIKDHQQCKARNASKDVWGFGDLRGKNVFQNWKFQLDRETDRIVSLVSPATCLFLVDLNERANNTNNFSSDFYKNQILSSSKEFIGFYNKYCIEMSLNIDLEVDIMKSIDYFKRSFYKQVSEYEIREWIKLEINYIFSSSYDKVYNALNALVINGNIMGKEITITQLYYYLTTQCIQFKNLDLDNRINPRLLELNEEYNQMFYPLKKGFILRQETKKCFELIEKGKSIIIDGKAGYGKSGATQEIISFCKKSHMPYIAIKLDKHIPVKNCEEWGKSLGLPGAITYCLHKIAANEKAVIILDQLDALRWTQANSTEAIAVCMELIRQVKYFNNGRENKIIIVFVCRSYDLENDNSIKSLFEEKESDEENNWDRVTIDRFDEDTVKTIVGDEYVSLSKRLKELLRIPSNLYIWQQLEENETYSDCSTTSHLIKKWYEQLKKKSREVGVTETSIIDTKEQVVEAMERMGRLFIPAKLVVVEEAALDYLKSAGMINVYENKISFIHQSFLDWFVSERMMNSYYGGANIEEVIGNKSEQSPDKRYQVQMLMQDILEYSSEDFLEFGKEILLSDEVRYYIKYVFYELMAQIDRPDDNIISYVRENYNDKHFYNSVIFTRKQYYRILRDYGVLDAWYKSSDKKDLVFDLLASISPHYEIDDVKFILKYAFSSPDDDKKFAGCFYHDIYQDNDEMFDLRMQFYEKHPDIAEETYIDIESMIQKCEMRTIRLISCWAAAKISKRGKNLYRYEEDLLTPTDHIFIQHGIEVVNELIQHIPQEESGEWSAKYSFKCGIERVCVELIKKANVAVIMEEPNNFLTIYETYMGKGFAVFNEIILHGLYFMPKNYSNQIIEYLSDDLDSRIFDNTSGGDNELGLVKKVIMKHTKYCEQSTLDNLVYKIIKYSSPRTKERYMRRIEQNRTKEYRRIYWSFWGDLQYELLPCIPKERMSIESKNFLETLSRKFENIKTIYHNYGVQSGSVCSPVSGKTISMQRWLQIITNKKIGKQEGGTWKAERGVFVESSLEMFCEDFRIVVSKEPEQMIRMVLTNQIYVIDQFVDSLYSGVVSSESLNSLSQEILEEMFTIFPCDMKTWRASYFCDIIQKRKDISWSDEVLSNLKDIALYHKDPEMDKPNITNTEDKEMKTCNMIQSNALNCVRGNALMAIGTLLWENKNLYARLKDLIIDLLKDGNIAVRYASLWVLWPVYNIDREFAAESIIDLYEHDIRLSCFDDTRSMLFLLYPNYKDRVINIITNCYYEEEEMIIEVGAYTATELYFRENEFEKIVNDIPHMNSLQKKAILKMSVIYFGLDDYNDRAKELIIKFFGEGDEVEFEVSRLFYDNHIDIVRDEAFLIQLMKSGLSSHIIHTFTHYLEEQALAVSAYAEIIFALCEKILSGDLENIKRKWGVENELSKLIVSLYDEVTGNNKEIALRCMDLWDIMFEKQIGSMRQISQQLMDR